MRRLLLVALLVFSAPASAQSLRGMWMPQQVPELAPRLREAGLQLDPRQFADLTGFPMGAVVSLGGCSASFVSPQGLVVTNHHCVYGALQFNSTAERDLTTTGFLARTLNDEIQATPAQRVFVTTDIGDVTNDILGNLKPRLSDAERYRTIERRQKEMISACEKPGGVRCLVAGFFEGTQYLKMTQMEIRDVRLVYAPAGAVGNYGGEVDNWMWPRHTGDFGFYRAYVGRDGRPADYSKDNVPYRPRHWLKMATGDLDPGDLMIVTGYPGQTFRYETAGEVRHAQEVGLPLSQRYLAELTRILEERGKNNKDVAIKNLSRVRGYANYMKKYEGTIAAFKQGDLAAGRRTEEEAIRRALERDVLAVTNYDRAMAEIAALNAREEKTYLRDTVLAYMLSASPMLSQANTLYRLSRERAKKDIDRAQGYQERDLPRIKAALATLQRRIEPGSDRAGLRFMLEEAVKLPADQRLVAVDEALQRTGQTDVNSQIDALLDRLYANTKTADLAARQQMFNESTAQLNARDDAMINFAADLRKLADENLRRDEEMKGAMARLRPLYISALRKVRGGLLAPDANGTLRVSFGEIVGYEPRDGVQYEPFTTAEGLLQKETGEEPFNSPPEVLAAIRAKEFGPYADPDLGTLPIDFLSTGDITNGSSGSASINARGELAGLAFDGNYEAMGSDYVVNPDVTRSIHVDSRYMLWIMDRIDGAHNLLREMGLPVHFAR